MACLRALVAVNGDDEMTVTLIMVVEVADVPGSALDLTMETNPNTAGRRNGVDWRPLASSSVRLRCV